MVDDSEISDRVNGFACFPASLTGDLADIQGCSNRYGMSNMETCDVILYLR